MNNIKNDLVYGNLNKEGLSYLNKNNIFTNYFSEFSNMPFNDFFKSTEEITTIIETQSKAEGHKHWEKIKEFAHRWDGDISASLKFELDKLKIPNNQEYIDFIVGISEELGALIMQLKNHYQRPRPFQLAYYSNQPLNPYETISGNTPAYPSGHATQGKFLTKIISLHYPSKRIALTKLSEKISESRIVMGLHYPSDNEFGEQLAMSLLQKDDIRKKYKLD